MLYISFRIIMITRLQILLNAVILQLHQNSLGRVSDVIKHKETSL
jgi:hypothetical protein